MKDTPTEVVRIGVSSARINQITRHRIEYSDEMGNEHTIDLEKCVRNWLRLCDDRREDFVAFPGVSDESIAEWNKGCVGQRGALDDPPWVEFVGERRTRFEFKTYDAVYAELLGPLGSVGWHTFDAN